MQTVVVTGASSGIGLAAALRFAGDGAAILLVGRKGGALAEIAARVERAGGRGVPFEADVTSADAPRRIAAAARAELGGLTTLVNAAGIIGSGTIENTADEPWDAMVDINLRAFPGVLAYCVSKAGVDQLTRCAALELAPRGIRVNAVNPGVVVTNLHRRSGMEEANYAAFLEHSKTTHPLGRTGAPEEIADLIAFLASDRAGWITGETISIDGGRHLTCAR